MRDRVIALSSVRNWRRMRFRKITIIQAPLPQQRDPALGAHLPDPRNPVIAARVGQGAANFVAGLHANRVELVGPVEDDRRDRAVASMQLTKALPRPIASAAAATTDASARHPKNWPLQVPVKECRNRTRSLGEVFRRVNAGPMGALALLVVCTENT